MKYSIFFVAVFLALAVQARADEVETETFGGSYFFVSLYKSTTNGTVVVTLSDITGLAPPPRPVSPSPSSPSPKVSPSPSASPSPSPKPSPIPRKRAASAENWNTVRPTITTITSAVSEFPTDKYTVTFTPTTITITVTPKFGSTRFFTVAKLRVTGTTASGATQTVKLLVKIQSPKP